MPSYAANRFLCGIKKGLSLLLLAITSWTAPSSKSTAEINLIVFVKTFAGVDARFALVDVTFQDFRDASVERGRIG